jgi:signal transduction histidine kinase
MLFLPAGEVVPFHLIWISFALAYGFEPWPVRRTIVSVGIVGAVSGGALVREAWIGYVAWEETTEIVLMMVLTLLVVWHVQRRQRAVVETTLMAERSVADARERERLARLTSHEMRTPITIASGYVDLLLAHEDRPESRADLEVVRDELGRLARAGERLVRTIRLHDLLPGGQVDLAELVRETVARWATVATRSWVVDACGGTARASEERLRACLDTLIENALRYTGPEATIRVAARVDDGAVLLLVADSGPGFAPEHAAALNDRLRRSEWGGAIGVQGQTGFGLGIVREIVSSCGGGLGFGRSREGGALVVVRLPLS